MISKFAHKKIPFHHYITILTDQKSQPNTKYLLFLFQYLREYKINLKKFVVVERILANS